MKLHQLQNTEREFTQRSKDRSKLANRLRSRFHSGDLKVSAFRHQHSLIVAEQRRDERATGLSYKFPI